MRFALGPKAQAAGYRIESHETIVSTNANALSKARDGDGGRLWVVSDYQSAGRGRRGSHWGTPRGNLAASLLIVVDGPAKAAATLGFVAGLALDLALQKTAADRAVAIALDGDKPAPGALSDRIRLKWPNDVLLDGGKLAGILLEAEPAAGGQFAVVVGIGVNVHSVPGGLPYPASALSPVIGTVDAGNLFANLSDAWCDLERQWAGGAGFGSIRDLWLARAAGLGEDLEVRVGGTVHRGIFDTIDENGRLVIHARDGARHHISAGDVYFAAMAASA